MGQYTFMFKDIKLDSMYRQLVQTIKSKDANNKGEGMYAYFALTSRCNTLYIIRSAWREKKVEKFYVDYVCCTVLYYIVLYCTILYYTVLYCIVLYCTVLYHTVLYYIILYCTLQYHIVSYYIILYYTVQYSTV